MDGKMDSIMEEIVEKMEKEGTPMIKLAALFIKEPLSLQALLMIEDNSPVTIDQISNDFAGDISNNVEMTDLLDKLKGFGVIVVNDNIVNIANRGKCIVAKLRIKMNNPPGDGGNLCDMKHGCVYDIENCKL